MSGRITTSDLIETQKRIVKDHGKCLADF